MIQKIYSPTALGQVNGIPMQENAYVGQRCAIRLALRPQSIYIQDTWSITDEITLNIGIRNSAFESKTGEGDVYADMDNQWAPRLGAI